MESALISTTTFTLLTLTKTLNPRRYPLLSHLHRHHSSLPRTFQLSSLQLCRILRAPSSLGVDRSCCVSPSRRLSSPGLRSVASGFRCVSNSAASFTSGDGGFGGGKDGNNGGGGGGNGDHTAGDGGTKPNVATSGGTDDVSALSSDVIILDVGGMSCGGCVASVKRILESQAEVSAASVNLTTETAIVWPVSEAKGEPDWRKQLGEALAKHLTNCGFESNLRGQGAIDEDIPS